MTALFHHRSLVSVILTLRLFRTGADKTSPLRPERRRPLQPGFVPAGARDHGGLAGYFAVGVGAGVAVLEK